MGLVNIYYLRVPLKLNFNAIVDIFPLSQAKSNMRFKIEPRLIFKVLKFTVYIVLFILALFLTWEVIINYLSRDSSFKQNQVPVTEKPVITVCFSPRNKGNLIFGKDFNISKYNTLDEYYSDVWKGEITLKEGENPKQDIRLTIIYTAFSGECYQLKSMTNRITKGML